MRADWKILTGLWTGLWTSFSRPVLFQNVHFSLVRAFRQGKPPLHFFANYQSRSQSFFPLASRREARALGATILKEKKETTEFYPSGFTAQSASMRMPKIVAPRVSRWSLVKEERRLWERDWPITCYYAQYGMRSAILPCIRRLSPRYNRQSKFWCPNETIR